MTSSKLTVIEPARQTCQKGYIFCQCFFFTFLYFNGRFLTPGSSESNGPIFIKISGLVDVCKCLFTSFSSFDFSRDVVMETN